MGRYGLILMALMSAGCVRAGFNPSADGGADALISDSTTFPPVDLPQIGDPGGPIIKDVFARVVIPLNSRHDTCANPFFINGQATEQILMFEVNTEGAAADYPHSCCIEADLILNIDHPRGGLLEWSCTGGGTLSLMYATDRPRCPPVAPDIVCANRTCNGTDVSRTMIPEGVTFIQICRDPGADVEAGLALLRLAISSSDVSN